MAQPRSLAAATWALLSGCALVSAATVTINGATFDAPSSCQPSAATLVCKLDGQQLEVWVYRRALSANVMSPASMVRKLAYVNSLHETAVSNIMRSTGNDAATAFSTYGAYSAVGSAMAGKGEVSAPTVRFASVLHEEEVWEFLEVVARRTPAVESLAADLQRTLVLPTTQPVAPSPLPTVSTEPLAATPPVVAPPEVPTRVGGSPLVATYSGTLLSFEHPGYLDPVVTEDSADSLLVNFKHKTRPRGGPSLLISLRTPKDKQTTALIVELRKQSVAGTMAGETASVEINKLGPIDGIGFALIGVPDSKKGLSGVESLETTFAANAGDRVLEVRLTAEQQYSSDARLVWAMLARSIKLGK